jgi:hypothetical protein
VATPAPSKPAHSPYLYSTIPQQSEVNPPAF